MDGLNGGLSRMFNRLTRHTTAASAPRSSIFQCCRRGSSASSSARSRPVLRGRPLCFGVSGRHVAATSPTRPHLPCLPSSASPRNDLNASWDGQHSELCMHGLHFWHVPWNIVPDANAMELPVFTYVPFAILPSALCEWRRRAPGSCGQTPLLLPLLLLRLGACWPSGLLYLGPVMTTTSVC